MGKLYLKKLQDFLFDSKVEVFYFDSAGECCTLFCGKASEIPDSLFSRIVRSLIPLNSSVLGINVYEV